jgi:hypothetical protein
MAPQPAQPDAVISLYPDRHAPRAARHCVRMVDRPSPDLRDVVVLLASELVTRAVTLSESPADELSEGPSDEPLELRVWMPPQVVRVELRGGARLAGSQCESAEPQSELVLLDELADRWSIDADELGVCVWFEIDRCQDASAALEAHGDARRRDHMREHRPLVSARPR